MVLAMAMVMVAVVVSFFPNLLGVRQVELERGVRQVELERGVRIKMRRRIFAGP